MKTILHLLLLFYSCSILAQQGKYKVIKGENSAEEPIFKKYDSRIWGSPKFYEGYYIDTSGDKKEGNIALFSRNTSFNFLKNAFLFLPKGSEVAEYYGKGNAIVLYQKKKKTATFYDYYNGLYLERLVTGNLRLSFNPAENTSNKISSFIATSEIKKEIIKKSIEKDLEKGKSLKETSEKAKLKSDITDVISNIEITEKEYLVYNSKTEKTILLTKDNYKSVLPTLFSDCSFFNAKSIKNSVKSILK